MNETISSADLEELHTLIRIFLSDSMNKVNTLPLIFILIISFCREVQCYQSETQNNLINAQHGMRA